MPRAKASEDDDVENDSELAKLQRQYRMAEGDRKAYSDESQNVLRKQKAAIDKLTQDNVALKAELDTAEGNASLRKKTEQMVAELNAKTKAYDDEIKAESAHDAKLARQVADLENKIRLSRPGVGAREQSKADMAAISNATTTMDNRLNKGLQKFNAQLTGNAKLRETIDHLKKERLVFDGLIKKLTRQINDQKKAAGDVIEASNQSYEERDEVQAKMAALREKSEKEEAQYTNEVKEMTRVLEHDRKLKSFMGVKGQDRARELEKSGFITSTQRQRAAAVERSGKPQEMVHSYEEAFERIKTVTGIQETSRLVDRFIQVEDENFSLFNFVNELNNEVELLQEKIFETSNSIEKLHADNEKLDQKRKKDMHTLEERLASSDKQATTYTERAEASKRELGQLTSEVESLFQAIGCDRSVVTDMLGSKTVDENNIMQHLGIIEQRVNEFLQMQSLLSAHAEKVWSAKEAELRDASDAPADFDATATLGPRPKIDGLLGAGPKPISGDTSVQIVPPTAADDFDSDDSDDDADDTTMGGAGAAADNSGGAMPMTTAELKAKVMRASGRGPAGGATIRATPMVGSEQ